MRVTRASVERRCAICERTLLMGERTARFSPNGGGDYVDVCPLCQELAHEYGWVKAGGPQPVRLAGRGHEVDELEPLFTEWNARLEDDGRIVPDIARL